jgi:Putative MetA-pathway of phenol degradation
MLHTVSENFYIGYNIGVEKRTWDYEPMYLYTFSPKLSFEDKWQAFIEIYGYFWKNRFPQTTVDGGLSYLINDNFKIDATAGKRIDKTQNKQFYAIGASFRFKTSNKE